MSDNFDNNKIRRRTVSSKSQNIPTDDKNNFNRQSKQLEDNKRNANNGEFEYKDSRSMRVKRGFQYESTDYNIYEEKDIKTYNPRRIEKSSREKFNRENRYNDSDLKQYNPKRASRYRNSEYLKEDTRISRDPKVRQFTDGRSRTYTDDSYYNDEDYYEKNISERNRKKFKRVNTSSLGYRIMKRVLTVLLVLLVVGGSAGFLYVRNVISDMPVVTKKVVQESYINKEPVPLSKIPKNLQNAVISIEDERFYKHGGIDIRSLIRSAIFNITNDSTQGGSTIDMQLSKNLLTNNQRTLKRKIQDMYNAIMINKVMTKDEILEAYLNNIYMGKSAYGVQAGAQLYFGKDVSKLTFGQSTMLAGITNNPRLYQDYEQAKKRQALVLYKMYRLGYIKENVYKAQLYRDTPFKSEID